MIGSPQCSTRAADHLQLALAYLEIGHHEQALVAIRRAARERGASADQALVAAYAHLGLGRFAAAREAVLVGLERWPSEPRLHRALRELCGPEPDCGEAQRRLEPLAWRLAARDSSGPPADLQATLGWLRAASGDPEGALTLLRRAAAAPDSGAFPALELSRVLGQLERWAEARQIVEDALAEFPDSPELLLAVAQERLRHADTTGAREAFERLLSSAPQPGRAAVRAAMASYQAGVPEWAAQYYERALALGNDAALVRNNLAWTYAEQDWNLDRAHALAAQAVEMEPGNPVYLDTYAEVHFRLGRTDRALAIARLALEKEPPAGQQHEYLQRQLSRFAGAR